MKGFGMGSWAPREEGVVGKKGGGGGGGKGNLVRSRKKQGQNRRIKGLNTCGRASRVGLFRWKGWMVARLALVEVYETVVTLHNCEKLIVRRMSERHTENTRRADACLHEHQCGQSRRRYRRYSCVRITQSNIEMQLCRRLASFKFPAACRRQRPPFCDLSSTVTMTGLLVEVRATPLNQHWPWP